MLKRSCVIIAICILFTAPAAAAEFTLSFEWGDIPLCTTGRPNVVDNPRFVLSHVPEGTKHLQFKLTDLDVPSYDHGGGTVAYTGNDVIDSGAFQYRSPCPPSGSHRYRWTVTAKEKTGFFSGSLGKATMTRKYP